MAKHRKTNRKINGWSKLIALLCTAAACLIIASIVLTLCLRWINPPYSSFMLVKNFSGGNPVHKIEWMDIQDISPHLLIAVVAAEDQKFPDHFGFDLAEIQSAFKENRRSNTIRGASTITQQVAKNTFLWPDKSLFRKGLEAYFTVLIEALWPKWRILEVYVNVAEFGPNLFGAQNAAQAHFRKSANELTRHEATLLAAVLPNPNELNASQPSNYVIRRAKKIAGQIRLLGGHQYLNAIWD